MMKESKEHSLMDQVRLKIQQLCSLAKGLRRQLYHSLGRDLYPGNAGKKLFCNHLSSDGLSLSHIYQTAQDTTMIALEYRTLSSIAEYLKPTESPMMRVTQSIVIAVAGRKDVFPNRVISLTRGVDLNPRFTWKQCLPKNHPSHLVPGKRRVKRDSMLSSRAILHRCFFC